jgi:hypothetical protein
MDAFGGERGGESVPEAVEGEVFARETRVF